MNVIQSISPDGTIKQMEYNCMKGLIHFLKCVNYELWYEFQPTINKTDYLVAATSLDSFVIHNIDFKIKKDVTLKEVDYIIE